MFAIFFLSIRLVFANGSELVFPSQKTGNILTDVKTRFIAARRETGLVDLRFHDLRHTTGTRLADSGPDIVTIAEVLGHQDLRMTKRYTHATDERKRLAMERLARYSTGNGQKLVKTEKGQPM